MTNYTFFAGSLGLMSIYGLCFKKQYNIVISVGMTNDKIQNLYGTSNLCYEIAIVRIIQSLTLD